MSTRPRSALLRRLLVPTTALLVAGAGIAAAAPAQAVGVSTDHASLTWGFSAGSRAWGVTTTGGVTPVDPTVAGDYTSAKGFTLSGGEGRIDSAGTGSVDFAGSVTYSPFAAYGAMVPDKSTVTLADFELDVTSATEGTLSAAVSYHKPEGNLAAKRVTVAAFDITALSVTDAGFTLETAAPDWAGAVADGTYAAGYTDAWPTPLVDVLRTVVSTPASQDVSVYFFRSGSTAGNDAKAPLAISASGAAAKTVTNGVSYAGGSVAVDVDGEGFTGSDGNPGDDGIYVGLAPAGGLPDVSSQDAMDNFAAATWVSGSSIVDGSFASSLVAKAVDLDRGTAYSIYTWRAHGHSTTSQDTETPVSIDWSKLVSKSTLKASLAKVPTTRKGGRLAVVVTGASGKPAGKVTVRLSKQGKAGPAASALLKGGKATVTLPRLAKGSWKAVVTYAGSDTYETARKTLAFKVG